MKKLFVIILMLFCIMPIVLAELDVDEISLYINDNRDFGVDKSGGDIVLYRGDEFYIKVYFKETTNSTRYYMEGDIKRMDYDRIRQPHDGWISIDKNQDEIKIIDYGTMPDDVPLDEDYEVQLDIYYEYYNGSLAPEPYKYRWELIMKDKTVEKGEYYLEDALVNISNICTSVIDKLSLSFDYIGKYSNVSTELSTCKEERGTYKSQADECDKTKIKCETDRDEYKQDKEEAEQKIELMISKSECKMQSDNEIERAVNEAEKKKDNMMIGIAAVVGVIGFILWKKKKGVTVYDKIYQEKRIP